MTQQFEVGQVVKTEGGHDAEILKTDAPGDYPIIAFVDGNALTFTEDVRFWRGEKGHPYDLILPEPKITGFINVYRDGSSDSYTTRELADYYADEDRTHFIDPSDLTDEQIRKWRVEDKA